MDELEPGLAQGGHSLEFGISGQVLCADRADVAHRMRGQRPSGVRAHGDLGDGDRREPGRIRHDPTSQLDADITGDHRRRPRSTVPAVRLLLGARRPTVLQTCGQRGRLHPEQGRQTVEHRLPVIVEAAQLTSVDGHVQADPVRGQRPALLVEDHAARRRDDQLALAVVVRRCPRLVTVGHLEAERPGRECQDQGHHEDREDQQAGVNSISHGRPPWLPEGGSAGSGAGAGIPIGTGARVARPPRA